MGDLRDSQRNEQKRHWFNRTRFWRSLGRAVVMLLAFAVLFTIFIAASSDSSNNADMSYKKLHYTVHALNNGDLKVDQTVTIALNERSNDSVWRQLYQQYNLGYYKGATDIKDISVKDIKHNITYSQTNYSTHNTYNVNTSDWNSSAAYKWYIYDVTEAEDYYSSTSALGYEGDGAATSTLHNKKVEIGMNIPVTTSGTYTFKISMTLANLTQAYKDAAFFQWEPISSSNKIPIEHLSGTIYLPKDSTKTWGWMHYEGNGVLSHPTSSVFTFSADNVSAGTYVDLLGMYRGASTSSYARQKSTRIIKSTVDAETEKEKTWHNQQVFNARKRVVIIAIFILASLALVFVSLRASFKNYHDLHYALTGNYRRNPPDTSPAIAAYLIDCIDSCDSSSGGKSLRSRQTSATMLSLASKGAIKIYPGKASSYSAVNFDTADENDVLRAFSTSGSNPSKELTIQIDNDAFGGSNKEEYRLSDTEDKLLEVLVQISKKLGSRVFDTHDMKSTLNDGGKKLGKKAEDYTNSLMRAIANSHITASDSQHSSQLSWFAAILGIAELSLSVSTLSPFALYVILGLITFGAGAFGISYGMTEKYSDSALKLMQQCEELRNYMLDFSNFTDRGAEELVLWDRYLVYAAAFGITDEVLKQMNAVTQSVINDPEWNTAMSDSEIAYMQWAWMPRSYYFNGAFNGMNHESVSNSFEDGFFGNDLNNATISGFSDFGNAFSNSLGSIGSTITMASDSYSSSSSSGGSFGSGGGSFGGGGGGGGGGSFGGR